MIMLTQYDDVVASHDDDDDDDDDDDVHLCHHADDGA